MQESHVSNLKSLRREMENEETLHAALVTIEQQKILPASVRALQESLEGQKTQNKRLKGMYVDAQFDFNEIAHWRRVREITLPPRRPRSQSKQ